MPRRAYRRKGTRGLQVNLSEEQKAFIIENKRSYTDAQLAEILNTTLWTVKYYRQNIIRANRNEIEAMKQHPISIKEAKEELKALIYYAWEYPSFKEAAYYRIKMLMGVIVGIYNPI